MMGSYLINRVYALQHAREYWHSAIRNFEPVRSMNAPVFNAADVARRVHVRSVQTVCNDLALDAVIETCDLASSYAMSAREAPWRGDRILLAGRLAQRRLTFITALDAHERLSPTSEGAARG